MFETLGGEKKQIRVYRKMFGERKSYSGLNPKDSGEELWITYKRKKCANPSSDSRGVSKISGGVRNAQEHLITYKRRRCANPGSDFGGVSEISSFFFLFTFNSSKDQNFSSC